MHWEILIVPLIALGVWILGTLFRTGEDERAKKGVRRTGGTPGRRPVTDLDRFLEEARLRREREERHKVPPPAPPAPAPRQRPPAPRAAPPVRRAREPVPVAVPVAEPVLPEALPVELAPAPPAPAAVRQPPLSPVAQQVRSLLSKPQTAAAAFALREIFDRPLCKRRR